jgi:hypothetical protein
MKTKTTLLISSLAMVAALSGCSKPAPSAPTGKWGYINKTGNFIIQPQFDEASEFGESGAIVRDGKRLLRLKAKPPGESSDPVKPEDTAELPPLPTLRAAEAGADTYQVKDDDKIVFDPKSVPATEEVFHDNDFVCVKFGAQYAYIDKQGKLGIPVPFKAARNFSDKRAAAMDGGKWGYINRKGSFVLPPKYLDAGSFAYGLAPVKVPSDAPSAKTSLF